MACPMRRGCLLGDTGTSLVFDSCGVAADIQSLFTNWFGCVAMGRNVGGLVSLLILCSG